MQFVSQEYSAESTMEEISSKRQFVMDELKKQQLRTSDGGKHSQTDLDNSNVDAFRQSHPNIVSHDNTDIKSATTPTIAQGHHVEAKHGSTTSFELHQKEAVTRFERVMHVEENEAQSSQRESQLTKQLANQSQVDPTHQEEHTLSNIGDFELILRADQAQPSEPGTQANQDPFAKT